MKRAILLITVMAALTACGEKPQTAGTPKSDTAPMMGTGVASYTVSGWTAGDKASWESALKARQQLGQNEYSRAAAAPAASQ
ncbi:MAG: hypothetical protein IPG42_12245 [Betaproteobacteria bacterium]|nr:hypothetical protein [Betaproteobacteria bacterium]MBK7655482.1 hypothetical protein [Betaproteobacteria bacterium]